MDEVCSNCPRATGIYKGGVCPGVESCKRIAESFGQPWVRVSTDMEDTIGIFGENYKSYELPRLKVDSYIHTWSIASTFDFPDVPAAYAEYAAVIGKAADDLTELEQKQAVVNWVLEHNRPWLLSERERAMLDGLAEVLSCDRTELEQAIRQCAAMLLNNLGIDTADLDLSSPTVALAALYARYV